MARICEYPGRIAVLPGGCRVWNRGGPFVSPYTDFAAVSMRRFCVENLSNEAAPRLNGRKETLLVSIPDFALRCKNFLEFMA
jgi:hypothetical protein